MATGRVQDLILNPQETGRITEVIAEGEYYGMQTFDQALMQHVMAGRIGFETAFDVASSPHDFKLMLEAKGQRASGIEQVLNEPEPSRSPSEPSTPRPARQRLLRAVAPGSELASRTEALAAILAWSGGFATTTRPPATDCMSESPCPVGCCAEIISGKWTLLVIRDLADSNRRFCELERSLAGISPRTLSLRLRALEECGIVARNTYPEVPPARRVRAHREGPSADPGDRGDACVRPPLAGRGVTAAASSLALKDRPVAGRSSLPCVIWW